MLAAISAYAAPLLLIGIPIYGLFRKVPVYELFTEGAKEGIGMVKDILPFLLGMLVAISVFRESGAFDALASLIAPLCDKLGLPEEVLPLAILRPLSGSGALGVTAEILNDYGPDSFIGMLASVMQGSTDTTFYILTVYFGTVGIKRYRYALTVGLSADMISFIAATAVCRLFYA